MPRTSATWAEDMPSTRSVSHSDFWGQLELQILPGDGALLDLDRPERRQGVEDLPAQRLGRRGAGGESDRGRAGQPGGVDLGLVLDEACGTAVALRDLPQPVRV